MIVTAIETIRPPDYANILWVRVETDEGLVGLGETFRGAAAVEAQIHAEIAPRLLGTDPSRIEALNAELTRPYVGYRSSGAELRAASAIDIALWDLAGQASRRPLHDLLGGLTRTSIRTYNTCAGYTYNRSGGRRAIAAEDAPQGPYDDQIAAERDAGALARSLLAMGIGAMKIWPFDPFAGATSGQLITAAEIDRALEPLRRIRDAVGDAMEVMIELHALWDLPAALAIARAAAPFRPFWMEDPLRNLDPLALADYRRRSGLPVCASETLATAAQFLDLLRAEAVDYVMLDIGWCGGLTQARRIAALAEAHQRPVAPHDCTGPVVFAASTHLACALPNAVFMESVRAYWSGWYRDLVTALPTIADGMIAPTRGPGLGLALTPATLAGAAIRRTTGRT
ncbi:mandelate racemase/muconate lactonizing enzyme family protein [Elioraea tepidiphila]|jgi:L-alanine-DL-glutamate epimerase-like enolase superfamily enzyme|uniref:mandelate racemase/muconate lactonizing enzyme family protein n=1 Tax=Elioraea tepidiphila TaxID=457934 RepID=UPI002FD93DC3